MTTFSSLGLSPEIVSALRQQGYETPTPIQAAAIPKILLGKDLLAAAQTGTGKTAAFMLPALEKLKARAVKSRSPAMHPVRLLVLTPTRELADQINQSTEGYLQHVPLRHTALFGGTPMQAQTKALQEGSDIVVATVGRLLDHLKQGTLQLNRVEMVVLDEADRMLDMGFIDDIKKIMHMLPKTRQTLLFSATFSPAIRTLAKEFMREPEEVAVSPENTASANIEQHVIAIDTHNKTALLERLIVDFKITQVIVFCKTKQSAERLNRALCSKNIVAGALHGDKTQQHRLETLAAFKEGKLQVLVATDVAARGLDIADLPFVINYELPTMAEDYIHRIGRTGRAGAEGVAISLMDKYEQKLLEGIKTLLQQDLKIQRIKGFEPTWWGSSDSMANDSGAAHSSASTRRETTRQRGPLPARHGMKNRVQVATKEVAQDAGSACHRIPGRKRVMSEKGRCALLQANYGAKQNAAKQLAAPGDLT